ncbi:hypothetical protein CQR58_003860 [Streptomyces acidiscabies]|uniref:hypothetical protein n=1 Tax=Streptomyces acidiscabies TaxID=42234 RepID=UPI0034C6D2CE
MARSEATPWAKVGEPAVVVALGEEEVLGPADGARVPGGGGGAEELQAVRGVVGVALPYAPGEAEAAVVVLEGGERVGGAGERGVAGLSGGDEGESGEGGGEDVHAGDEGQSAVGAQVAQGVFGAAYGCRAPGGVVAQGEEREEAGEVVALPDPSAVDGLFEGGPLGVADLVGAFPAVGGDRLEGGHLADQPGLFTGGRVRLPGNPRVGGGAEGGEQSVEHEAFAAGREVGEAVQFGVRRVGRRDAVVQGGAGDGGLEGVGRGGVQSVLEVAGEAVVGGVAGEEVRDEGQQEGGFQDAALDGGGE